MADVTISALDPGTPAGTGVIPYSDGNNTTKVTINQVLALQSGVPTGAVFHLATSAVPTGYLKCNGDTVPDGSGTVQGVTANFSALHAVLGATYGVAGALPDLRGEFVRGWDDARGIDTSRVFGSAQGDVTKSHSHGTYGIESGYRHAVRAGYDAGIDWSSGRADANDALYNYNSRTDATGGTETRPRNVALMPVIKY